MSLDNFLCIMNTFDMSGGTISKASVYESMSLTCRFIITVDSKDIHGYLYINICKKSLKNIIYRFLNINYHLDCGYCPKLEAFRFLYNKSLCNLMSTNIKFYQISY